MSVEKNRLLLLQTLQLQQKMVDSLKLSLEKCQKIGLKDDYSFEELESFDSLTSKFARTTDIFTQKLIKTLMLVLGENAFTFIDRMNKCEQLGLIRSAQMMMEIRELRNKIAHDYLPEALSQIFQAVLTYTQPLIENIETTKQYIYQKFNEIRTNLQG